VANVTKPGAQKKGRSQLTRIRKASKRDKQDMKNTKSITKITATFAILFSFATIDNHESCA
jgi:hypothetical protein